MGVSSYSVVFIGFTILLFVFFVFVVPADAVEPRWRWLADVINVILPGQHDRVSDFVAKYPWQSLLFIIVVWLLRRAGKWLKAGSQEFAFQAWQRTATVGNHKLPSPAPSIGCDVKFIKWVAPPQWLTCTAVFGFFLLLSAELLSCPSANANPENPEVQSVNCNDIHGICQLGVGESQRLTISANRVRNETGLILKADDAYTIRYIKKDGWRDKDFEVGEAEGFKFPKGLLGLHRFWWLEWRRPYPDGLWFQVVGRIDRNDKVFPVSGGKDPSQPYTFTPPSGGELVLFVNDVVYSNNQGVMVVEIYRATSIKCRRDH